MTKLATGGLFLLLTVLTLCACAPKSAPIKAPDALESGIDRQMGGRGTCVIIADTHSGQVMYQYNADKTCKAPLPPCGTFNIANGLIGLDAGVITPATVFKWDGSPQPVRIWQADANLTKAYKDAIDWWFQRLATQIGHDRYTQALGALGYGNRTVAGPLPMFWEGPRAGGGLTITPRQQVDFLQRLYAGKLPVKKDAAATIEQTLVDETRTDSRGDYVMSGLTGSCPSQADASSNVGWWVGRLKTPNRDVVFSASVDAPSGPPGEEVQHVIKDVFADAGLWPQE